MKFDKALAVANKHFPKLKIKYKDKSIFMKLLSYVLFFNKKFMTNYVTTIGNTIYYPSKEYINENEQRSIIILCHELMHLKQYFFGFSFTYLLPQSLALFGLLGFANPYWFICLLFLLPIPSITRFMYELEAYSITMYVQNKLGLKTNINNLVSKFTGPDYYYMYPIKSEMEKQLIAAEKYILKDSQNCFGMRQILDEIIGEANGS